MMDVSEIGGSWMMGGDWMMGGGWMMGDRSEFGIVGCSSVRARGAKTAKSDAQWRHFLWATMPKLAEDGIKTEVIQFTVPQTQEFLEWLANTFFPVLMSAHKSFSRCGMPTEDLSWKFEY
jgi:hypothetical protein